MTDALALRRAVIEKDFAHMNDMQKKAVLTTQGPVLVLAGAGSGKTTVLINRIVGLIRYGGTYSSQAPPDFDADDELFLREYIKDPDPPQEDIARARELCSADRTAPWNILAITFTNKAAGELKERLCAALGDSEGQEVWAGTFHSMCVRILRRDISRLGRDSAFTIYDASDSQRVLKDIMKARNVDEQRFPPKNVANAISRAKNALEDPERFASLYSEADYRMKVIGELYAEYQAALVHANALDFDDIIMQTVRLLQDYPDVLEKYQRRFKYVMVDEYQDTNHAQYVLVSLLSGGYGNICVVGDDDQSIYAFRGATIENILSFEKQFKNSAVIRLEQNYRSTGHILDAANCVIEKNRDRKGKTLWTANTDGERVALYDAFDDRQEAAFIADTVFEGVRTEERKFSDYAVLYRMNSQSALLEREFSRRGLPHRIIGGVRFYDRREIKDALAYLCLIANPSDDLRLKRIINEPKRGIGAATVDMLEALGNSLQKSMLDVCAISNSIEPLSRAAGRLTDFYDMIAGLRAKKDELPLNSFIELVLERSGYISALNAENSIESRGRLDNLMELVSNALEYEKTAREDGRSPNLDDFLEEISLLSDIDSHDPSADAVSLMTVHSAKGLEFPVVFIYGMEENIFPSSMSADSPNGIEEERRLCYVAITRAKRRLYITRAESRMMYGRVVSNPPSRFVRDIPKKYTEDLSPTQEKHDEYIVKSVKKESFAGFSHGGSMFSGRSAGGRTESFSVGQRVVHPVFGGGMVISSRSVGGDTLIEVAFDRVGTKKLMANFAKLRAEG